MNGFHFTLNESLMSLLLECRFSTEFLENPELTSSMICSGTVHDFEYTLPMQQASDVR